MTRCKYCNLPIYFDDLLGAKIPLDMRNGFPHTCMEKPHKVRKCRNCKKEIFFSPDRRNPDNPSKLIPQDIFGNHRCDE